MDPVSIQSLPVAYRHNIATLFNPVLDSTTDLHHLLNCSSVNLKIKPSYLPGMMSHDGSVQYFVHVFSHLCNGLK
uniref:Uncharacterized protein n=1 Tax=Octopus bimaculoides TaxID=37653 RepID=A0A0L8HBT5_OCTBM